MNTQHTHNEYTSHEEIHEVETPKDSKENDAGKHNIFLRIAVVIGILIILFLISIGIVKFIPKIFSSLASVNLTSVFKGNNQLAVSSDKKEVVNGESFTVSWKNNTNDQDGAYTFSYKCTSGVKLEYLSTTGKKPVICETLFPIPDGSSSYPFIVASENKENTALPFSINLWDKTTNKSKLNASGGITVVPKKDSLYGDALNSQLATVSLYSSNTTATSSNNTSRGNTASSSESTSTGSQSNNKTNINTNNNTYTYKKTYGTSPDLAIRLVEAGYVDGSGNYHNGTSIPENARVIVKFNVSNVGDAPTGSWTLSATLPTKISNERNYSSQVQPSILPGNSFDMNIAFDSFDPSMSSIILSTQSGNDVRSSNNSLSIPVTSSGTYNNYNGNNNYYSGNADLVAKITEIGTMDRYNNNFYSANSWTTGDKVGIKFEIQNVGGTATGQWYFKVDMPSTSNSVYNSSVQNSLAPGQKMTFTLGFDNPRQGSNYIQVSADNNNNVYEQNENNNTDSRTIYVNSNGYNNSNNGDLSGSCYVSPSNPNQNQNITWIANAGGGNGNYTYSWSGDAYGYGSSVSNSYSSGGTKNATVTIYSNGQSIQRTCSVYVNGNSYYNNDISGSCSVYPNNPGRGQTVTWTASASGGNGNYTYSWSGDVSGSGPNQSMVYNSGGTKTSTVAIYSNGNSIQRTCTVYVNY